jgi:hypothetical protein
MYAKRHDNKDTRTPNSLVCEIHDTSSMVGKMALKHTYIDAEGTYRVDLAGLCADNIESPDVSCWLAADLGAGFECSGSKFTDGSVLWSMMDTITAMFLGPTDAVMGVFTFPDDVKGIGDREFLDGTNPKVPASDPEAADIIENCKARELGAKTIDSWPQPVQNLGVVLEKAEQEINKLLAN